MGMKLAPGAPRNNTEAFAYIRKLEGHVTVDDLKILALIEAMGLPLYKDLASKVDNPEAKALLLRSGREELAHGRRVARAIEMLSGEHFVIPPIQEHPFYTPFDTGPLTKESLDSIIQGEIEGERFYQMVAGSFDNDRAGKLFAQNGKEERQHADRLRKVSKLLFG